MGERQGREPRRIQAVGTACSKAHSRNSEEARCQEQTRPGSWREAPLAGWAGAEQGRTPCLPKVSIPGLGLARLLRDGSKEEGWGAECSKPVGPEPLLGVDCSAWSLSTGPVHGGPL